MDIMCCLYVGVGYVTEINALFSLFSPPPPPPAPPPQFPPAPPINSCDRSHYHQWRNYQHFYNWCKMATTTSLPLPLLPPLPPPPFPCYIHSCLTPLVSSREIKPSRKASISRSELSDAYSLQDGLPGNFILNVNTSKPINMHNLMSDHNVKRTGMINKGYEEDSAQSRL